MLVVQDEGGALSRLWRGRSYACPNKQIGSVIYCVRRRWGSRPQRWRANLAYRKTASALGSASLWPTVFSGRCDRGQHPTYRRALSTEFLMLNNDLDDARAARSVIHVISPVSSSLTAAGTGAPCPIGRSWRSWPRQTGRTTTSRQPCPTKVSDSNGCRSDSARSIV